MNSAKVSEVIGGEDGEKPETGLWIGVSVMANTVGRLTEGFYDTASHRSQQESQHKTVYQKETTLPK